MTHRFKNKFHKIKSSIILFLLLSPSLAFAQTEVGRIVRDVCTWLSGEIAGGIAVLAVIYSGYEIMQGEIEKKRFVARIIGIGLVVGGAYITNNILGVSG